MKILHQPEDVINQRYRIIVPLGQGGMGTTYEAEDLTNYKRVAIKVIFLQNIADWKILELFEREAKVLAKLNHPSIPKYLDYFHLDTPNDRRFYLVQELVAGETLANLVKRGWHADENKVKRIAIQILKILEYLHELKPAIIHRDIKPQNIVCRPDGRVFLVDFGAVQDVYRNTMSAGNTFVGTLNYMPLEQLRGQTSCGSDLYSLGVTLLFLLTHRDPSELPQLRMKINFREKIQVSSKFAAWLDRMLEPAVEDRFQSASEALKALGSGVGLKYKKPAGSKLVLTRNEGHWVLNIPSMGARWSKHYLKEMLKVIAWNIGLLFIIKVGFNILLNPTSFGIDLWTIAPFFLMPAIFFLLLINLVTLCVTQLSQQIEINLNQQILKYNTRLLWFNSWSSKVDIRMIEFNEISNASTMNKNVKVELFNLDLRLANTEGKTKNLLRTIMQGLEIFHLTPEEKDWIFAELSDFLAAMPSSHPEK